MKKSALLFAVVAACFLISGLSASENDAPAAEGDNAAPAKEEPAEKKAAPILTRHGFLYSAEISRLKPEIQEVKGDQPQFPNPAWAAVILKLPKNRGVSRFDYELKTPSGSYPCLAVALEAEPFSQARDHWTIEAKREQEGKFVRMLFALPSSDLDANVSMQNFELVFQLRKSVCQPPAIPFRILPKDQALNSDPKTLGENGNIGLTWLDMHPELQVSLDDDPTRKDAKAPPAGDSASDKAAAKTDAKTPPAGGSTPDKAGAAAADAKTPPAGESASDKAAAAAKAKASAGDKSPKK